MVDHPPIVAEGGRALRFAAFGSLGVAVLAGLFYLTWKSQFAAPPGYLFGTRTQPIEAGYCLAVSRQISPGGGGGYIDETRDFWLRRLRDFGGDLAGNISKGEAALGAHLEAYRGSTHDWLVGALDQCSRRALNYGARFRSLE